MTENPVSVAPASLAAAAPPTRSDVEEALAKDPDSATLKLVDSYYASELQKMRSELQQASATGDAAVMGIFARLTEAPTCGNHALRYFTTAMHRALDSSAHQSAH